MAIHKNSLALTALSQLADRSRTIATKSMRGNNIAKWLPKQCIICCFSASTVLRFGLIISKSAIARCQGTCAGIHQNIYQYFSVTIISLLQEVTDRKSVV